MQKQERDKCKCPSCKCSLVLFLQYDLKIEMLLRAWWAPKQLAIGNKYLKVWYGRDIIDKP